MALTPAQRKAIRNKYEAQDKAKKNIRLGISPKKGNSKNKKRK